ncbi:MAG: hypothetical protein UX80_C0015G0023 [Candidatus Amesbacteria bacterium GW2011_GWA2_47_11b]|uniref:Uncharacterized protein n=1 Tax=Candidatus Amesbacteria bacterium GW2011_GWA2_47_11b TaxID=1618358 RepID=A0A0G1RJI0_9BACT|nr:MAG: hypothetical protein UX80_C0015G0023 [Candidatus Amesbacteria bacterium GW2011_GWA2_47_11b]
MVDVLLDTRRTELLPSVEQPHRVALMALPGIEVKDEKGYPIRNVRLAMHTDNLGIFLSALSSSPELASLKIEGRVITEEQFEELKRHPVYRFYMSGRVQRARQTSTLDVLIYLLPRDLNVDQQEASRLLELPFSPPTLSREVGFRTGFFEARKLVEKWQREGNVNTFLPQFGGVNELTIGSDSLSQRELEEVTARIARRFQDEQAALLNQASVNLNSLINLSSASLYQPLVLSKFSSKEKIEFSSFYSQRKENLNNKEDYLYGKTEKEFLKNY